MAVLSKATTETSERRREAEQGFIEAAGALLDEGGSYLELTVEQIAARAGRPRTAFYLYFRDRRELLVRMSEQVTARFYTVADRWWSGTGGALDVRPALEAIVAAYREHAGMLGAIVEASAYDQEIGQFWRNAIGQFIEATKQRLVQEGHEPEAAAGKAYVLCWMTERSLYQHVVRGGPLDDAALVDSLIEVGTTAVYGPSSRSR